MTPRRECSPESADAMSKETTHERKTMLIRPLAGVASWAMNEDIDVRVATKDTGILPLEIVDGVRWLTPSEVRRFWEHLSDVAATRGHSRIGLLAADAIPYQMFAQTLSGAEYLGMRALLHSATLRQSLERYIRVFPTTHLGASVVLEPRTDERSRLAWDLNGDDPGADAIDYMVALLTRTMREAFGQPWPVKQVALRETLAPGALRHDLFADAEIVVTGADPWLEFSSETLDWTVSEQFPREGSALDDEIARTQARVTASHTRPP